MSVTPINPQANIEEKLRSLYTLQQIDSKIDEIHILKGELPIEVRDLEDEIAGLETRVQKLENDTNEMEANIAKNRNQIKEFEALSERYTQQQNLVKNNREFESLAREIENCQLDIKLANRNIKTAKDNYDTKLELLRQSKAVIDSKKLDLNVKQIELNEIIKRTENDEKQLSEQSKKAREVVEALEARLLKAYDRTRTSYKNGLSVITIERNSCGGCFNQIPPQRQIEIRQRKKITLCEHCGRIIVDEEVAGREFVKDFGDD